jgi:hypothetical protein
VDLAVLNNNNDPMDSSLVISIVLWTVAIMFCIAFVMIASAVCFAFYIKEYLLGTVTFIMTLCFGYFTMAACVLAHMSSFGQGIDLI